MLGLEASFQIRDFMKHQRRDAFILIELLMVIAINRNDHVLGAAPAKRLQRALAEPAFDATKDRNHSSAKLLWVAGVSKTRGERMARKWRSVCSNIPRI